MLSKKQFDLLCILEKNRKTFSQRALAKLAGYSIGSVNSTIAQLTDSGFISDGMITAPGIEALEPYKVKRAVFIAAGFGSRMVPVTLSTPKPLVRVKGVRIIDTLLDAVISAGIEEIIIVRGYLGNQFDQLLEKYPMIKFIENPKYNEANNISSVYLARNLLSNAYIFEADLVLSNPNIVTKYQYSSNYLAIPVDVTDDWCFYLKNNRICKMSIGGKDCFQLVGISYWDENDGKRLAKDVESVFTSPGGKERYWDQVALEQYIDDYDVTVRPCSSSDIVEIDTYKELQALDPAYC